MLEQDRRRMLSQAKNAGPEIFEAAFDGDDADFERATATLSRCSMAQLMELVRAFDRASTLARTQLSMITAEMDATGENRRG